MRAEPRTRNATDTTLKFAIRAHAKQTKDPDVQVATHGISSICNSVYARYFHVMHNMVFSSLRPHSDTWLPRGSDCDRLVVNLLLALHSNTI